MIVPNHNPNLYAVNYSYDSEMDSMGMSFIPIVAFDVGEIVRESPEDDPTRTVLIVPAYPLGLDMTGGGETVGVIDKSTDLWWVGGAIQQEGMGETDLLNALSNRPVV